MDPSSEAVECLLVRKVLKYQPSSLQGNGDQEATETASLRYPWMTPTVMNVISGTVAGLAGVIAGHPFDTVKVRLQNESSMKGGTAVYRSTLQTFKLIIKEESAFGLFKGMSSPLVGVAVINAFLFGIYGKILDLQRKWSNDQEIEPGLIRIFWAGAGSGFVNSFISGPTELAKIQLQVQKNGGFRNRSGSVERIKGPVDCLKRIYRLDGLRGVLRGMSATMWRETPSYGVYFASFEAMQRKFIRPSSSEDGQLMRSMKLLVAGGLSGIFGWLSTYPMDVIKTKIQAQPIEHKKNAPLYTGIVDCTRRIVGAEGPAVLWRGLGATVIRAFPANAVIFLAYSTTIDLLEKQNTLP